MIVISEFAKSGLLILLLQHKIQTGEEFPYAVQTEITAVNYAIRDTKPEEDSKF